VSERSVEQLANEWVRRLELSEPFTPVIPKEGLFPEQTQRIAELYQQIYPSNPESPINRDFYEAYRQHIEQARPELEKKLPTIQERFKSFYKNTGVDDYEPIEEYPRKNLAGLFGSAQHEIYAHELPYQAGLMPDYSGFYAGKNNLGDPYVFGPSSLTPFNEAAAVQIDEALRRHFKGEPINVANLGNAFDDYFSYSLKQAAVDPESKNTLKERVKAFYPPYVADVDSKQLTPVFNKAGQLFLQKYVLPAAEQYEGTIRTQFPGLIEKHGALHGTGQYDAVLRVLDQDLAAGRPFISTGDLYLGIDPAAAVARGTMEAAKSNPYGAAGGAALTLLNDEVAKSIAKDDYKGAATAAVKDVLLGAAAEAGLKNVAAPLLQRAAPGVAARVIPAVAGAAQYGIPAAVGAGLFTQGRSGSALNTLVNKAAPVVPGLKPDPKTDIGRRTGDAILNEGRYLLRSILQNRVPYLKGRLF
jgi:hypothetical protein